MASGSGTQEIRLIRPQRSEGLKNLWGLALKACQVQGLVSEGRDFPSESKAF